MEFASLAKPDKLRLDPVVRRAGARTSSAEHSLE